MPLVRASTVGASVIASAQVARQFDFTVAAGTTSLNSVAQLQCNNLPNGVWYVKQTNATAGGTFTPWFAVENTAGNTPNWTEVTAAQALVPGAPIVVQQRIVPTMMSITVTAPGGGPVDVTVILSAST